MPATKTMAELKVEVRERADMVGSLFVSDAELARYINKGIRELCDKMEEHYGEEYFVATPAIIATTGSTDLLPLPTDFLKLLGLDLQTNGNYPGAWLTLHRFTRADRNRYVLPSVYPTGYGSRTNLHFNLEGDNIKVVPPPVGGLSLRLHYVPRTPYLVDPLVSAQIPQIYLSTPASTDYVIINGESFSGTTATALADAINARTEAIGVEASIGTSLVTLAQVDPSKPVVWKSYRPAKFVLTPSAPVWTQWVDDYNGWLEYAVLEAARLCKIKENTDISAEMLDKGAIVERISRAAANRNAGEPPTVSDVVGTDYMGGRTPFSSSGL